MFNNMLATTAANQQRQAEQTGKAWKIAGGIIGAVALTIAAIYTGGSAAIAAGTAAAGSSTAAAGVSVVGVSGLMATAGAGYAAGSALGGLVPTGAVEVGRTLTEWYESYEDAIAEAKKAQDKTDAEEIKKASEELSKVSDEIVTKMYQNAKPNGDGTNGGTDGDGNPGDGDPEVVVD